MKTRIYQHSTSRQTSNADQTGRVGTPLTAATQQANPVRNGAARWGHRALPQCFCVSAVMLLFGLSIVHAQSYSIDWYKVSGGGGTSTGGVYSVSGTIGQHDAGGPMTGGSYSLTGGFWSLISVVQTPGAPALYISHSGNTVTVYWQETPGWTLEQNSDLKSTAGWSGTSGITTANGTNYVNVANPTGNLFYRLKQ